MAAVAKGRMMRHNSSRRDFLKLAGLGAVGATLLPRLGKSDGPAFQGAGKAKPNLLILDIWLQNSALDGMGMLDVLKR